MSSLIILAAVSLRLVSMPLRSYRSLILCRALDYYRSYVLILNWLENYLMWPWIWDYSESVRFAHFTIRDLDEVYGMGRLAPPAQASKVPLISQLWTFRDLRRSNHLTLLERLEFGLYSNHQGHVTCHLRHFTQLRWVYYRYNHGQGLGLLLSFDFMLHQCADWALIFDRLLWRSRCKFVVAQPQGHFFYVCQYRTPAPSYTNSWSLRSSYFDGLSILIWALL